MPEYDIGFGPLRGPGNRGVYSPTDESLIVPGLQLGIGYVSDSTGRPMAVIKAVWQPPSIGEDLGKTTKNKVVEYWVSERVGNSDDPDLTWSPERKLTARHVEMRNFGLNILVDFRVRARTGSGIYGPYSTASIDTKQDTTAPEKPSTPALKGALRGIVITWDGLDHRGAEQPNDFETCKIEISTESATAGFQLCGTFPQGGGSFYYNVPDLLARKFWCRLRSQDTSQNESVPSDVAAASSFDFTAAVAAESGANSVRNASFEIEESGLPTSWDSKGTLTLSLTGSQAKHGATAVSLYGSAEPYLAQTVSCLPERLYVVSGWVYKTSGALSFGDRTLLAIDGAGVQNQAELLSTVPVGSWTRVRARLLTHATASELTVRLYAGQSATTPVLWDAVQIEVDTETPFAPKPGEIGPLTLTSEDLARIRVTSDMLVNDAVIGPKIASDAVTARHVLAGSLTTSRLTVGSLSANLVPNSNFEEGLSFWGKGEGPGTFAATATSKEWGTTGSTMVTAIGCTSYTSLITTRRFPVLAGRSYYAGLQIAGSGLVTLRMYFFDAAGTLLDSRDAVAGALVGPAPARVIEGQAIAPALAASAQVGVFILNSNTSVFTDVQVRAVTVSALIADGAIHTNKVSAQGISADRIAAGTISAAISILAPTIHSGLLSSGTIEASKIRGGSMRATVIETGEWFDFRIAITEDSAVKDSLRWYGPGSSSSNPYTNIKAEIRGRMGNIGQFGLHLNSHVQIGHQHASLFQLAPRVAVGGSVHGDIRVRAGVVTGAQFDSGSKYRVNFDSWTNATPTYVGVTFTSIVVAHSISDITTTGFTVHVRFLNGGSFAGQFANFTWFAEQFNRNPFAGMSNYV